MALSNPGAAWQQTLAWLRRPQRPTAEVGQRHRGQAAGVDAQTTTDPAWVSMTPSKARPQRPCKQHCSSGLAPQCCQQ